MLQCELVQISITQFQQKEKLKHPWFRDMPRWLGSAAVIRSLRFAIDVLFQVRCGAGRSM